MTARTATITPSVARGRTVVIDSYTAANFAAIGNLRRDIAELSNQRRRFELAHELAHHVLAQEETNQTGMVALLDAYRLLQQFAPLPAVDWPTSLPGTVTAPAVDLVELTHALPEFRLPAWRSGTLSTASMLTPIDTAQTAAAPVAPAQHITLKTASPDATFLRFIVPVALADAMAKGIPGATVHIIAGEGHFANVQAPEKVNPYLASALGIPEELVPKR